MITKEFQLPVFALRWLLLAQAGTLLLHVSIMPIWLIALVCLCFSWRWRIIAGRLKAPGNWTKAGLALVTSVLLLTSFDKITVAGAVNLLLVAYTLKLIEMHSSRDAYISLFLSFLVAGLFFLFHTSILSAVLVLLVVVVITIALISIHLAKPLTVPQLIKQASSYWLAAVPVMLVLFVFFPRMPPLWSIDVGQNAATGISDEMNPGDIASLSQSDKLAFRVRFLDEVPSNPSSMYWRGLVLDFTDGRGWKHLKSVNYSGESVDWYGQLASRWQNHLEFSGESYPYEVIMEASNQSWLFSLDGSLPQNPQVGLTQDFTLQYERPVRQTLRYSSSMPVNVARERELFRWRLGRELQIPENENPKTRQLAIETWQNTGTVQGFVNETLKYFVDHGFVYTLRPPTLGQKANDQFLFETRRGFCAHFAGALALMARYAGIPARVVVGYQGGEWNEEAGYLSVRQYDAHAWTEVWYPNQGWQRIDPTSVISPDRVELGLQAAMQEEGSFLQDSFLSPHKYQGINWLNATRQYLDWVSYQWDLSVVGYDSGKQKGIWSQLAGYWGRNIWLAIAGMVVIAILLPITIVAFNYWWGRRPKNLTARAQFESKLKTMAVISGLDIQQNNNKTPREYFNVLKTIYADKVDQIDWLSKQYEMLNYNSLNADDPAHDRHWRYLRKVLVGIKTKK